jgi:hypothetical protein
MAETQPVDLETPSPDEELALADADLDEGTEQTFVAGLDDEEPPPIGRSWAFDWSTERFVMAPGAHGPVETYGDQTLAQWIIKTLHTAQGAHAIYPSDYGMREPNRWFGRHLTGADYAQLEADVHDALTYHPRIVDVTDFEFEQDDDMEALIFTCTVVKDDSTAVRLEGVPFSPSEVI